MNSAEITDLRPLKPEDLDRVVEIDARITGRSRRLFFEKRLQAALADPHGFIALAVEGAGAALTGYAIARLQNGEFGDDHRVAVLDVIGVDPDTQHSGAGTTLLEGISARLKKMNISELRTQVDWQDRDLTHFFAAAGFDLAFDQVLERPLISAH